MKQENMEKTENDYQENLIKQELKVEIEDYVTPQNSPQNDDRNIFILKNSPQTSPNLPSSPIGSNEEAQSFLCNECNVKLINRTELEIHSMLHSKNRTCLLCNQLVKNRTQFAGHIRKHMAQKPFLCSAEGCDKTFPHPRDIKLHEKVHNDIRPFECKECGKGFKSKVRLVEHEVVHTGEKKFKCKICGGAFATRASYGRHIKNMHEAVRSYACNYCHETFNSRQDLDEHKLTHRDIDGLKCQTCQEEFFDKDAFNKHKLIHDANEDSSGACEYCANKTFYFSLKSHMEKKHVPRTCSICQLVFYDEKTFQNHQNSHLETEFDNNKDLSCPTCGKQFDVLRYLKAHMQRHAEDYRKFICYLCNKGFSSKRDLKDHIMVHTDTKDYLCNICNKAFRTKQSVLKHKAIHSDLRPFECDICFMTFKKRSILSKHLLTHSTLRPFKCDCGKDFKSRYALNSHKKTHNRHQEVVEDEEESI